MTLKKYSKLGAALLGIFSVIILVVVGVASVQTEHADVNHAHHQSAQDDGFAERERAVMPFDMDATLHIFEDTATGGVQRVVVNDANDTENIALIRSHLKEEAKNFAIGDFGDPSFLHGEAMAGLKALQTAGEQGLLEVSYNDLESGGQIVYSSSNPEVIIALHLWFQAQVSDHGEHARHQSSQP